MGVEADEVEDCVLDTGGSFLGGTGGVCGVVAREGNDAAVVSRMDIREAVSRPRTSSRDEVFAGAMTCVTRQFLALFYPY